jgi:hypothetical protein
VLPGDYRPENMQLIDPEATVLTETNFMGKQENDKVITKTISDFRDVQIYSKIYIGSN